MKISFKTNMNICLNTNINICFKTNTNICIKTNMNIVCCAKELFLSEFNNLHETELAEGENVTKGRCKNVHFIIKVNMCNKKKCAVDWLGGFSAQSLFLI